jgi:hypothetical protein
MKRFKGLRSLDDIKQIATENFWLVDTQRYEQGNDFITLSSPERIILYNVLNGQFMIYDGKTMNTLLATHESTELEGDKWYLEVLNMFYL